MATTDTMSSNPLPVQLYCPGMRGIQWKTRRKSVEVVRAMTNSTLKPTYRREGAFLSAGRQSRRHARLSAAAVKKTPMRSSERYTWKGLKWFTRVTLWIVGNLEVIRLRPHLAAVQEKSRNSLELLCKLAFSVWNLRLPQFDRISPRVMQAG